MNIRFNHVVLATVAIVFIVTSANAKNAPQNLVSNKQLSPLEPRESMANNANSTAFIESTASARQLVKGKKLSKLIDPVRRNKNFHNSNLCTDLGLTKTSTGECKPIFEEE